MISEIKHSPNHELLHSSHPSLILASNKMSQKKMQPSPNISTQLSPSSGSLLKRLNMGNTSQEDLEVKKVLYLQNQTQSHSLEERLNLNLIENQELLLGQSSLNNPRSEFKSPVFQTVKRTLLERMENPKDYQTERNVYSKQICHGTVESPQHTRQQTQAAQKLEKVLPPLHKIIQLSNTGLPSCSVPPVVSLQLNGRTSSKERLLISTASSAPSTISLQSKRMLDVWDQLRLVLDVPNLLGKSKRVESGPLHGMPPLKRPHLLSPIERKNSVNTATTWTGMLSSKTCTRQLLATP